MAEQLTLKEMAERALALRLLSDTLKEEAKLLSEQVAHQMRQIGTDRITVTDGDLTELGKLTKNPDRKVWGITDPIAFKRWVEEHRPDMLVTSVNPSFVQWVLKEAEVADGVVGDPETGEQIPGVGLETKIGNFVVTKSKAARERAAAVVEKMMNAGVAALPPVPKE